MDKPKNLEQAVLVELEKEDIFPLIPVAAHLVFTTIWTDERLQAEVASAKKDLLAKGKFEQSHGIARGVAAYLQRKKFTGKEV